MAVMNAFRIAADMSHTVSKCILLWAMHMNRSAEGISLITQWLYAIVFSARYLDLFWRDPFQDFYLTFLKIFYILSSYYIIFMMVKVFPRTREREKAWKLGAVSLGSSAVLGPLAMLAFVQKGGWGFFESVRTFSLVLESVCILPQLILLRQTSVPTVIDSFYLLTLGAYRALYIGNWISRGLSEPAQPDPNSVIFGVIQTLLYADFAWVYYSRQRVKLRNGAIIDSEDFRRGFLVSKVLGQADRPAREEADREPTHGEWGPRGISVSADELEAGVRPTPPVKDHVRDQESAPEAQGMLNPNVFEDDDSDADDTLTQNKPSTS